MQKNVTFFKNYLEIQILYISLHLQTNKDKPKHRHKMTREILTRIAKENNITISYYDEVDAFITPNGKKVVINFAYNMGAGTYRDHIIGRTVVKLVSSIERNAERTGITSSDYCTQGWTRIFDVRWAC